MDNMTERKHGTGEIREEGIIKQQKLRDVRFATKLNQEK